MRYNGVITKKLSTLYSELGLLRGVASITVSRLESDKLFKHGIERSLQICVECMLDIANRISSINSLGPHATSMDAMLALQHCGVIRDANDYIVMVKFRNFIVHRYESVDSAILVDICQNRLIDFERFAREIEGGDR